MASAIDPTKPVAGNPTTQSVRDNFAAAKSEIEVLQQTAGVGPQGPKGDTGPSGTLTVGTVTTGAAGTNATVNNSGSTQAAVLNFTIPRGDAGTGGGGITETQAKDAVRQGNVRFEEVPATTAPTWPTTPNGASAPVLGANWTLASGSGATGNYTHAIGSVDTLAYPVTIANGADYQIAYTMTNVPATSTATAEFFTLYFRTAPTVTTGQQNVLAGGVSGNGTLLVQATGNFTHLVVVPVNGWQGNFSLNRIVVFTGDQNSVALSIKDWAIRVRGNAQYDGGGGKFATTTSATAFGFNALRDLTTGANNVAIGEGALSRNTTGGQNIAVGARALRDNMIADGNIAIGYEAILNNQSGTSNTAVGYAAMSYNHSGTANVGVGYGSLYYNRTGGYNVGVGYYALGYLGPNTWSAATVANSTGIGYLAGGTLGGSNNVVVGYNAMYGTGGPPSIIRGSNIVTVGAEAGRYQSSGVIISTIDNSLLLGYNTRTQGNAQTNQTVIGYNAIGHGSNTITLGNDAVTALHCNVQTISALSDERVKENVKPVDLNQCVNALKSLPVSQWDWLPIAGAHQDKHEIGFMSDDVKKVFPGAVTEADEFLTVRDADGQAEMTTVTEPVWTPPDQEAPAGSRTQTRMVEKTVEIKGLKRVALSQAVPTLWGAVQQLISRIEELEKQSPVQAQPLENQKPGLFGSKKR